jgi:AcrR family transcriptional regulator
MAEREQGPARRRLSRERVVAAALAIVDRDGLGALTMRALGRELGVDPMAVYHWVASKDALLTLLVEAVYREIPLDPALLPKGDWKARFRFAAAVFRDTLRRHPNALPVLATHPATTPEAMKPVDFALGILRESGFAPADAIEAVSLMANYVIGFTLSEVGLPPGAETDVSDEEWNALFAAMTPEEFPNVVELLQSYEFDWERRFAFGLDTLTRGLEPLRAKSRGAIRATRR